MMKKLIFFIFVISSFCAFAIEERTLGRSSKGLLMGDAFTSLATDEFSLFYNPALLARHKGLSFYPLNPKFTVINALADTKKFTKLGSDANEIASSILGTPVHIGLNYAPGFKLGRFGLSAIVNMTSSFSLKNKINPRLDIDYTYDRGFIMGYAFPVMGGSSSGDQLSIGVSTKYVKREAIDGSYYLFGTSILDAVNGGGGIEDILKGLGKVKGSGWGADFGIDYIKRNGGTNFSMSLAALDVFTKLHTEKNEGNLEVPEQPLRVNFGTAFTQNFGAGFKFKVSADIRNLQEKMEFMRRVHLGTEISLTPALSLYGGINSIRNYSYGLMLNSGIFKLILGFYSTEIGEKIKQERSNRVLLSLSFFSFDFDPNID